jgi:hypothetical protein
MSQGTDVSRRQGPALDATTEAPPGCNRRCHDRGLGDGRGAWRYGFGYDRGLGDRMADDADSSYAGWSKGHVQSPSVASASSASIEAMIA